MIKCSAMRIYAKPEFGENGKATYYLRYDNSKGRFAKAEFFVFSSEKTMELLNFSVLE